MELPDTIQKGAIGLFRKFILGLQGRLPSFPFPRAPLTFGRENRIARVRPTCRPSITAPLVRGWTRIYPPYGPFIGGGSDITQ